MSLPLQARADLMDLLLVSSAEAIHPDLERAHLNEVRRRVAHVQAGKVQLVPGEQVLAGGRALLTSHLPLIA